MPSIDPNQLEQTLCEYVKAGGDKKAFVDHFNSLDDSGKVQFAKEAAQHYGIGGSALTPENPQGRTFTPDVQPQPQTSVGDALVTGIAQAVPGASQIQAGIERGLAKLDPRLSAQDAQDLYPQSEDVSKEYQQHFEQTAADHPVASAVGVGLGSAPLMAVAPGGALGRVALSAAQGASMAGEGNRLQGAKWGALFGAGGEAIAAAPALMKELGSALENSAYKSSVARLGLGASDLKDMGVQKLKQLGQFLQAKGLTNVTGSIENLSKFAGLVKRTVNSHLDNLYSTLEKGVSPEILASKNEILGGIEGQLKQGTEFVNEAPIQDALDKVKELTKKVGPDSKLRPTQIRDLAQQIEDMSGKYGQGSSPAEMSIKAHLQDAAGMLRGLNHSYADSLGADFGERFANASEQSQLAGIASGALKNQASMAFKGSNSTALKSLYGSAVEAGKKVVGAAPVTAKEGTANIINAALKSKLGKFSSVILQAANKGPQSVAANHFVLMQSNPDYRAAWAKLNEEEGQ